MQARCGSLLVTKTPGAHQGNGGNGCTDYFGRLYKDYHKNPLIPSPLGKEVEEIARTGARKT